MVTVNELIEDYDELVKMWREMYGKTERDYPTHEEMREFIKSLRPTEKYNDD